MKSATRCLVIFMLCVPFMAGCEELCDFLCDEFGEEFCEEGFCEELVSVRLSVSSTAGGEVLWPGIGEFYFECDCLDVNIPLPLEGESVESLFPTEEDFIAFLRSFFDCESVVLQAQADPGFEFSHWAGSMFSPSENLVLLMDRDHDVKAHFVSAANPIYVDANAAGQPGQTGAADHPFASIQQAIDHARDGATIIVASGEYPESLRIGNQSVHLTSADPCSPHSYAYPVVQGTDEPVVAFDTFFNGRSASTMEGFILSGGDGSQTAALRCNYATVELAHCVLACNRTPDENGSIVRLINSHVDLVNCTFANNAAATGIASENSEVFVRNSILTGEHDNPIQTLSGGDPNVNFSTVAGGYPGNGNLTDDPLFAMNGLWALDGDPNQPADPFNALAQCLAGDHHLQSTTGRWDPTRGTWVTDAASSPAIDAGDPGDTVGGETAPNGSRRNQGAYGGTDQASQSE